MSARSTSPESVIHFSEIRSCQNAATLQEEVSMERGEREFNPREVQQYVWGYFELHANQRMSVFKFFIGLATFLTASQLAALVQQHHIAGALLGALLGLTSFVFWRLDERTAFLIKRSERALEELEQVFLGPDTGAPGGLQLFAEERMETDKMKGVFTTYRQCLKALFFTFGAVGISVGVVSLCRSMH